MQFAADFFVWYLAGQGLHIALLVAPSTPTVERCKSQDVQFIVGALYSRNVFTAQGWHAAMDAPLVSRLNLPAAQGTAVALAEPAGQ